MVKVGAVGILGAFVLFYVVTSPDNAAAIVHNVWNLAIHPGWNAIVNVAHGIGRFINSLTA